MITTDDNELAQRLRALRSHGLAISAEQRHRASLPLGEEELHRPGYNYRMTDIQAAIGTLQLDRLEQILARRRRLARRYTELLGGAAGITPPFAPDPDVGTHAFQSYMVLLEDPSLRTPVMERLHAQGIATRPSLTAIHEQPFYRELLAPDPPALPTAEALSRRGLMLPLYPSLTEEEQDQVVAALLAALAERGA
jgi:dTDP-4-amino-4,6-dideoxygalactose transaminase